MIVRCCKSFIIINRELYKRSVLGVFQRCVQPEEGRNILYDIHDGECGHHASARSLVANAFRHGFYWLSAHADAVKIIRACAGCQKYANQSHLPGYTHLLVAVNKFTKWVEAKSIKKCDGKTTTKFLRELIYRYGFPHCIITDNGTNFAMGEMAEFCEDKGIRLDLASVAHPESNGQAERANQSILHGFKPRLQVPLE
nr:uncharacterized protein LOC127310852 [Lolium perenne]